MKKTAFALSCLLFAAAAKADPMYAVYDFTTNRLLEGQNIHTVHPIASVTKIMTAHVFLKHNPNAQCMSSITDEDVDRLKGTKTRLPFYTAIACDDLLKAMLVSSDNYAAHALSRSAGMSRAEFIQEMNQEALRLGMHNTRFYDSSGLSEGNVSTVADLTVLSYHALLNPKIRNISNISNMNVNPIGTQPVSFRNTNRLVREGSFGALLSKTGYIRASGYNLVFVNGTPCRDGKTIGVISLNHQSSQSRSNFTAQKLQEYGCGMEYPLTPQVPSQQIVRYFDNGYKG